jgi:hypothetical protein
VLYGKTYIKGDRKNVFKELQGPLVMVTRKRFFHGKKKPLSFLFTILGHIKGDENKAFSREKRNQ